MQRIRIILAGLLSLVAVSANATLIGDTIRVAQNYPFLNTEFQPASSIVGGGLEYVWAGRYTVDVSASAIDIRFSAVSFDDLPEVPNFFNGPVVSGLDFSTGSLLKGFSNFSTNTGFSVGDVLFGSDWIGFNVEGLSFSAGQFIHVDLDFGQGGQSASEPSSIALLGLGLIGLGFARRKIA